VCACAGAWALAALAGGVAPARAATASQLSQQIAAGQGRVSGLSGAVGADSGRIARIGTALEPLQAQLNTVQASLNAKSAALLALQSQLSGARTQLLEDEVIEAKARSALSQQLVATYESDRPDLVAVVLEAKGFNDLLERVRFASTIQHHDAQLVQAAKSSRELVAAQATRLGGLEQRQQALTLQVLQQRDRLAQVRLGLVEQQAAQVQRRAADASKLGAARHQVSLLQSELSKLVLAESRDAGPAGASGPIQISSGGGFVFPMPRGAAVSPGSWSLDQGVDIAAPGHTPLLAVGSGTIVLHGIGGFGPSAPVLHLDSGPYVYYGHAGPGNWVPVGTHVAAGQVISEVGAGIVGISSGPHLEIGFADSSGTPLGPQTHDRMMTLLQAAFGG
jgi:murein DD-endopeptidase MepM/ murein hydrolase activator NlpD